MSKGYRKVLLSVFQRHEISQYMRTVPVTDKSERLDDPMFYVYNKKTLSSPSLGR